MVVVLHRGGVEEKMYENVGSTKNSMLTGFYCSLPQASRGFLCYDMLASNPPSIMLGARVGTGKSRDLDIKRCSPACRYFGLNGSLLGGAGDCQFGLNHSDRCEGSFIYRLTLEGEEAVDSVDRGFHCGRQAS